MDTTKLPSTAARRRVFTLRAPELAMLARFALLQELHPEIPGPGTGLDCMGLAAAAYVVCSRIEGLDYLWTFVTQLASDWILQQRLS